MEPTLVLSKTDAARALLAQRDSDLARAVRSFLIMVDGQRSLAQLKPMMDALGLTLDAVRHLVAQGLLHFQQEAEEAAKASRVVPRSRSTAAPERAARPVAAAPVVASTEALMPAAAPVQLEPTPSKLPEDAGPPRSLPAAKFYALNLVTLMLAGQDEAPRRAVREATTPRQLADWLAMCLDLVHDNAGPERAQLFADKIWAVLPDDARELLGEDWTAPRAN